MGCDYSVQKMAINNVEVFNYEYPAFNKAQTMQEYGLLTKFQLFYQFLSEFFV